MKVTKMKVVPINEKQDAVLSVVSRDMRCEAVNMCVIVS